MNNFGPNVPVWLLKLKVIHAFIKVNVIQVKCQEAGWPFGETNTLVSVENTP